MDISLDRYDLDVGELTRQAEMRSDDYETIVEFDAGLYEFPRKGRIFSMRNSLGGTADLLVGKPGSTPRCGQPPPSPPPFISEIR